MKKVLSMILTVVVLLALVACGSSHADEETNAKSILNRTEAYYSDQSEQVNVKVVKVEYVMDQTAYNNSYTYFAVQVDTNDWGYAEFRNGEVIKFWIGEGMSHSEAKRRCEDQAKYRLSSAGGIGQ